MLRALARGRTGVHADAPAYSTSTCSPGQRELSVTIPRNQLRSGRYTLDLYLLTAQPQDYLLSAKTFEVVVSHDPEGDPRRVRENLGLVSVEQEWGELRQQSPNRV